jgi:hypothetical protein
MSDSWTGPAELRIGDADHVAVVRLSGRFEPVEGRYRWAGRTSDRTVADAFRAGARDVTVRIAGRAGRPARLGEPDPWGGIRLTGTGAPPWDVTADDPPDR